MMSEETIHDDQSHYEISLTAGQAFLAFVLLLLSLAASFAFGLMIGKGQGDDRLVVRKEPAVITEASAMPAKKGDSGKIVELGVNAEDFKQTTTAPVTDSVAPATITEVTPTPTAQATGEAPVPPPDATPKPSATSQPAYAQLLSSSDQKTAEALAAKLIGSGFTGAYVDRGTAGVFKVRVKFASEGEARAAESKLKEFAKDVFIVK